MTSGDSDPPSPFSELLHINSLSELVAMGRTTPTTTELLRREIEAWKPFRQMLPKSERKEFDAMLQSAQLYRYAMMTSLPQHPIPFRPIVMSILFRHYQQLQEIKKDFDAHSS